MSLRTSDAYTEFVKVDGERVRVGLVASFGPETGADATAEALAYGWRHWARISEMDNPAGYLYTVGRNWARRQRRAMFPLPASTPDTSAAETWVEPGLTNALASLSVKQRTAVVLVHGLDWTLEEAAQVLGIGRSTVHKHASRGLERLRRSMGAPDAG